MRVEVLRVHGTEVEFSCDLGRAIGHWVGPPPTVAQVYFVELDTDVVLEWGTGIVAMDGGAHRIEPHGDGVVIDATLESYDVANGVAILRLGSSLVVLETHGDAPGAGTAVRVHLSKLTLHDTRY